MSYNVLIRYAMSWLHPCTFWKLHQLNTLRRQTRARPAAVMPNHLVRQGFVDRRICETHVRSTGIADGFEMTSGECELQKSSHDLLTVNCRLGSHVQALLLLAVCVHAICARARPWTRRKAHCHLELAHAVPRPHDACGALQRTSEQGLRHSTGYADVPSFHVCGRDVPMNIAC